MTDPSHIAEARKKIGRPQIREVFLRNGAHIEPGRDDLPDWVYESMFELLEMGAPAVQQPAPDVAGLLNRIIPRIDAGGPNPIDPDIHCCEWTLHRERERIHAEFADALAAHEEELFRVRQDRDAHLGEMMRALEQVDAMKAECETLHKAIRRLCNIYVVDDYYSGDLREERLNQAITAAMEGDQP